MSISDAHATQDRLSGINCYTFNLLSASPNLPAAGESLIALRSQLPGGSLGRASRFLCWRQTALLTTNPRCEVSGRLGR